ncbi:MAG: DUF4388 domain-containing protein [Myxococcota bacterium]|nr:DUF4388 domain-containing protein [Myxococcota bacterium]
MAELTGSLQVCSAPSLIQLAEWQSWTGTLSSGSTRIGFRDGLPVAASRGDHSGRLALLEWFLDEDGEFRFSNEEQPSETRPLGNPNELVMEGIRVADEWARVSAKVLEGSLPGHDLPFGTGLPLWQLVASKGALRCALLDPVSEAIQSGQLKPMGDDIPEGTLPEGNADDLLLDARRLVRSGEFDRAELLLRQVLLLSPGHPIAAQNLRRLRELRTR